MEQLQIACWIVLWFAVSIVIGTGILIGWLIWG
jgi:hypothetical protein